MASRPPESRLLHDVPLFPLPNVVLFPRAILPLHIFEPRYRRMMQDALAGPKQIAMALLKGNWQQNYHRTPEIHDVVCVGEIVAHEQLEDGRYNLLLEGRLRARVVSENRSLSYRRADLEALPVQSVFEIDLADERERLIQTIHRSDLNATTLGLELGKLLKGPVSTVDVADICAFNLLEDVEAKQRLLEDIDAARRVRRIVDAVRAVHPVRPSRNAAWPRPSDLN